MMSSFLQVPSNQLVLLPQKSETSPKKSTPSSVESIDKKDQSPKSPENTVRRSTADNRENLVLDYMKQSILRNKSPKSPSESTTFQRSEKRSVSLLLPESPMKEQPDLHKIKEHLTADFNKFGSDISMEIAIKMIHIDARNSSRYLDLRKILLSFGKGQFQTQDECFAHMLSTNANSVHYIAMILLLFSQKEYINQIMSYPEFSVSKYGKLLLQTNSRGSTTNELASPSLSPRKSTKTKYLSLEQFKIFKEDVEFLKVTDSELPRLLKCYEECQSIGVRAVSDTIDHNFQYLVISSETFTTIIDIEQLNKAEDGEEEPSKVKLRLELKEMFLALLKLKKQVIYVYDVSAFTRLLRDCFDFESNDIKSVKKVVDRKNSVMAYSSEQAKPQELSVKFEEIYSEIVNKLYGGRIDYEASLGCWKIRPTPPEQAHYLALSTFVMLKLHESFDTMKFEYKVFSSLRKAYSLQKGSRRKTTF